MADLTPIRRTTYDDLRATIEDGILYLGYYAVHRKPLAPHEIALVSGCVQLCDGAELLDLVRFARKLDTPGEILAALEAKKNPPPKPVRRPRRGSIRSVRLNPITGVIMVERW